MRISPTAPTMPSWGPPITASPVTPVRKKGQAELIRMHALERGFEAVGYNGISQSATGAHAKDYWAESPKFGIGQGQEDGPRRNEPP